MADAPAKRRGTITILCPNTGRRVSTGFTGLRSGWERPVPIREGAFRCPECEQVHVWSRDTATFVD